MKWWTPIYFIYGLALLAFISLQSHIDERWNVAICGGFGAGLMHLFRETTKSLRSYRPATALAAKVVNEQIKLTSNTVNAVAVAFSGLAILSPIITKGASPLRDPVIVIAVIVAFYAHVGARKLLEELKSEATEASIRTNNQHSKVKSRWPNNRPNGKLRLGKVRRARN
jgi:hypothetical protein